MNWRSARENVWRSPLNCRVIRSSVGSAAAPDLSTRRTCFRDEFPFLTSAPRHRVPERTPPLEYAKHYHLARNDFGREFRQRWCYTGSRKYTQRILHNVWWEI
ncbi:uncharacterized protein [Neodiprion pinetum]|uniref:uncharacterized protein n=1 Tax=Neodiprion pinetum TaxID=441929 RepID=UPI00371D46DD